MYDTPPIKTWSFTRLDKADTCMRRAELEYVKKIPDPTPRLAADRGSLIHKQAEDFVLLGAPLTPEIAYAEPWLTDLRNARATDPGSVEVENEWGVDCDWAPIGYFDPRVWGRIKLDALLHVSPIHAALFDWKTGKKFGNEVKHMLQEQAYNIAAFMRYPALQTITSLFVYTDQKQKTERTTTRAKAMLALPALNKRALKLTTAVDFPARPNAHTCRFCPYKPSGTGDCPIGVDA